MITAYFTSILLVVLAEMGDKTQLLAMALATRYRWQTVMWGVLVATLLNHFFAVAAGNYLTALVPLVWVKTAAAISFILFGLWTLHPDRLGKEADRCGRSPFWTVVIAFFIAEMGDKTQLMTVALAADAAAKIGGTGVLAKLQQTVPVWMGTTCGMLIADAIGILVGIVMHRRIPQKAVHWVAACCFVGFGLWSLHEALDVLMVNVWLRHPLLLAAIPVLLLLMYLVATLEQRAAEVPVADPPDRP